MLVKYINESTVKCANNKKILKYDDKQVINPKDENFIEAGYKTLEVEEEPLFDSNTQYLEIYYEEQEKKVIQRWKIVGILNESENQ